MAYRKTAGISSIIKGVMGCKNGTMGFKGGFITFIQMDINGGFKPFR